jgi:PKD repeat protein
VQAALGNIPPTLDLPTGGEVPLNVALSYSADVSDFEDPFPCCTVRWVSNVDGTLSTTRQLDHTFTTPGPRTITVTATDSGGASVQASFSLNVVNYAPVASIFKPTAGTQVFRGAKLVLRGRATDRNEPGELLACNRLVWTSSIATDFVPPLSGCEHEVSFASNGSRTLTLTATDPQGLTNAQPTTVQVNVVEPQGNLPPFVNITNPKDFANIGRDETITLSASVSDPENTTPLSYQWTVKVGNANPTVLGSTPTVQWKPSQSINFSNEGTYRVELRLNVTDPAGNTGTDFVTLEFVVVN